MTKEEVIEMIQELNEKQTELKCISYRDNVKEDLRPVVRETMKDLDEKLVSKFIVNAKADKPKFAEFSDEEILLQFGYKNQGHFRDRYINPLLDEGILKIEIKNI